MKDTRRIIKIGNCYNGKGGQNGDVYSPNGLCPTILTGTKGNMHKIIEKDNRKIRLLGSYNGHQSGNIYDENGLSPSLCCTDYKAPVKVLVGGQSMDKNVIEDNFTKVDEKRFVTTERERENVFMQLLPARVVDHCIRNRIIMFWKSALVQHRNTLQEQMALIPQHSQKLWEKEGVIFLC